MKPALLAVVALLAAPGLSAQAPNPAPATPLNPVGNYSFQVALPDGTAIAGTFVIKGQKDAWEGTISGDAMPEAPITAIGVEGQILKFTVTTPDGVAVPLRLTFTGDNFTGNLNVGGAALVVSGKRVKTP